jgi:hypothetical protein
MNIMTANHLRLRFYKEELGDMTMCEALEEAMHYDRIARTLGYLDTATKQRMLMYSRQYLEYAAALESMVPA